MYLSSVRASNLCHLNEINLFLLLPLCAVCVSVRCESSSFWRMRGTCGRCIDVRWWWVTTSSGRICHSSISHKTRNGIIWNGTALRICIFNKYEFAWTKMTDCCVQIAFLLLVRSVVVFRVSKMRRRRRPRTYVAVRAERAGRTERKWPGSEFWKNM